MQTSRAAVRALAHIVLSVESIGLIESLMDLLSCGDSNVVSEVRPALLCGSVYGCCMCSAATLAGTARSVRDPLSFKWIFALLIAYSNAVEPFSC